MEGDSIISEKLNFKIITKTIYSKFSYQLFLGVGFVVK